MLAISQNRDFWAHARAPTPCCACGPYSVHRQTDPGLRGKGTRLHTALSRFTAALGAWGLVSQGGSGSGQGWAEAYLWIVDSWAQEC